MIQGHGGWTKTQWREVAKAARATFGMSEDARRALTAYFLHNVIPRVMPLVTAAYWPIGNEIDARPLLYALQEKGLDTALPRVEPEERAMEFYLWRRDEALEKGPMGLSQPAADHRNLCHPELFLLPLLAFDRVGNRLGYGMGHFDASLEKRRGVRIGLAYAEQEASHVLPAEPHDVKLDAVLTPQGVIWFK